MSEKTIVVISAPYSNRPTLISSTAGKELYRFIKAKYPNVETHLIPDDSSIHKNAVMLQQYAKKGNVLFCYFGHGLREKICGKIPPGCKDGMFDQSNVGMLKNVLAFALCCWTSHTLGRLAEESGVKSYVGFRAPVYVAFSLTEHNYQVDIIDVWHQLPKTLLEGGTVAEGVRAMDEKSRVYEDLYEKHMDDWLYADYYKLRFRKNINILTPFGDLGATLL